MTLKFDLPIFYESNTVVYPAVVSLQLLKQMCYACLTYQKRANSANSFNSQYLRCDAIYRGSLSRKHKKGIDLSFRGYFESVPVLLTKP